MYNEVQIVTVSFHSTTLFAKIERKSDSLVESGTKLTKLKKGQCYTNDCLQN